LAVGRMINREFRLVSLFLAAAINLILITLHHYLLDYLGRWFFQPIPGDPYHGVLAIGLESEILMVFSAFFIAAWLGCRSPRQVGEPQPDRAQ
jgi:hypothetical protein